VCVCASMCVREREGERERETKRDGWHLLEALAGQEPEYNCVGFGYC